jgi:hypothetical protein
MDAEKVFITLTKPSFWDMEEKLVLAMECFV